MGGRHQVIIAAVKLAGNQEAGECGKRGVKKDCEKCREANLKEEETDYRILWDRGQEGRRRG